MTSNVVEVLKSDDELYDSETDDGAVDTAPLRAGTPVDATSVSSHPKQFIPVIIMIRPVSHSR